MNLVVFITAADKKEAEAIARSLVEERLAACVNIIEGVSSLFRWQGKVEKASEALLIVKSRKALMNKLIKKIKSLHSYELPEIIALPVISGEKRYLEWVDDSTR
ncbi:MAG: divalent-cation tolerance protein CutA [Candidatus Omnitrophota bacterium]|jgi:periplasmic divalent cation tolerance protein